MRPFTLDGENKAINLLNLALAKAIPGAPVKSQCAGDYFYGEDLVLEKRLQAFEGQYAARLKAILAPGYVLSGGDAEVLKEFWLLQYLRTDAAARTTVQMADQLDAETGGLPEGYLITLKDAVQTAMNIFFEHRGAASDLGVRLVRNRTDRPFITSDNPAVMANRWHLSDRRTELIGPGLESAGLVGLLPLSPDVLCVIYDSDLYTMAHIGGWTDVEDAADIDAFNAQQALSAQANLYFRAWEDRGYVADLVEAASSARLPARYSLTHAVFDHEANGVVTFRAVSAEEAKGHERSMVHMQQKLPSPSRWPSVIRWRAGGVVHHSGRGGGFVRRGTRSAGTSYQKIKVRP